MAKKEAANKCITEAQAKAAGITPAQAVLAGGYQKAFGSYMGKANIDDAGNLLREGKIIDPEGNILDETVPKAKAAREKAEKREKKNAKTAETEYNKRLKVVEKLRDMSLCPGWQSRNEQILAAEHENHEAMVTCKPTGFLGHQAMVQCMRHLQASTGKEAIEALNRLNPASGDLPLWGKECATAKYVPETGIVEITYPETKGKKEATK